MTSADSRLAAASNEIRVRVESSKNRLTTVRPRSVGSFLTAPVGERRPSPRRCRGSARASSRSRSAAESRCRSCRLLRACRTRCGRRRRRRCSASGTWTVSDERGREVLADVVGADRQLAVAAVDEHGELDGARAGRGRPARRARRGWCGRRRARRRRGRRPCRRCRRRDVGAARARGPARSRRSSRYIVMSSDPTGTVAALDARRCAAASRRASGTPRVGMPSRTRSAAPLLRSRISWAMRVSARSMSAASRTVRARPARHPSSLRTSGRRVWDGRHRLRTSFPASQDGSLKDVGRRPHLPGPSRGRSGQARSPNGSDAGRAA